MSSLPSTHPFSSPSPSPYHPIPFPFTAFMESPPAPAPSARMRNRIIPSMTVSSTSSSSSTSTSLPSSSLFTDAGHSDRDVPTGSSTSYRPHSHSTMPETSATSTANTAASDSPLLDSSLPLHSVETSATSAVTCTPQEPMSKEAYVAPQRSQSAQEPEPNAEFSCNICFDTSMSPVLTLCGHLFCWSCLHQWLDSQRQNPTCPVCKAGCAQDKVIPIYGRGKEQLDPRSTTPKRPAGQRPEPMRSSGMLAAGQVTFSGTMLPPFMFSPFGIHYGATYSGTMGVNGAVQTPMQAYVSRMFFMLGTLILVGILLY